jgi:hypothetical protein
MGPKTLRRLESNLRVSSVELAIALAFQRYGRKGSDTMPRHVLDSSAHLAKATTCRSVDLSPPSPSAAIFRTAISNFTNKSAWRFTRKTTVLPSFQVTRAPLDKRANKFLKNLSGRAPRRCLNAALNKSKANESPTPRIAMPRSTPSEVSAPWTGPLCVRPVLSL